MTLQLNYRILLLIVSTLFLFSCEKFDEGGKISQSKKNITNRWALKKVYKNDVDLTAELVVRNFHEEYYSGGMVFRSYDSYVSVLDTTILGSIVVDSTIVDSIIVNSIIVDSTISDFGNWNIDFFNQTLLTLTSLDTIFNFMNDTIRIRSTTILKLTKDELWYSFLWIWKKDSVYYQFNFEEAGY